MKNSIYKASIAALLAFSIATPNFAMSHASNPKEALSAPVFIEISALQFDKNSLGSFDQLIDNENTIEISKKAKKKKKKKRKNKNKNKPSHVSPPIIIVEPKPEIKPDETTATGNSEVPEGAFVDQGMLPEPTME